jgi:hypothetical protein
MLINVNKNVFEKALNESLRFMDGKGSLLIEVCGYGIDFKVYNPLGHDELKATISIKQERGIRGFSFCIYSYDDAINLKNELSKYIGEIVIFKKDRSCDKLVVVNACS